MTTPVDNDLSYGDALERAVPAHRVILGPAPCKGCGAWVEWAGVEWLALGTAERHDCRPYLMNGLYRRTYPDREEEARRARREAEAAWAQQPALMATKVRDARVAGLPARRAPHAYRVPGDDEAAELPPLPWRLIVAVLAVAVLVAVAYRAPSW